MGERKRGKIQKKVIEKKRKEKMGKIRKNGLKKV